MLGWETDWSSRERGAPGPAGVTSALSARLTVPSRCVTCKRVAVCVHSSIVVERRGWWSVRSRHYACFGVTFTLFFSRPHPTPAHVTRESRPRGARTTGHKSHPRWRLRTPSASYFDSCADLGILRLVEPIGSVHLLDLLPQSIEHFLYECCQAMHTNQHESRVCEAHRAQRYEWGHTAPLSVWFTLSSASSDSGVWRNSSASSVKSNAR